MTPDRDYFFLREIENQCTYALFAIEDANKRGGDIRRFWFSVQGFLISVANTSKILWPGKKQYEERGASLRQLLEVPEDSLIRPRTFRNHFEHFDERLEIWFSKPKPPGLADGCIGPLSCFGGLDRKHYLRNYATDIDTLFFQGEEYKLSPICKEIRGILERTQVRISEKMGFGA